NTATVAVTVSVDRTGPTVVLTPARAADADGWYQSAVTIHATCIDSGSGIATCPGDQTVTADGNRTVTATAVDRASNTATATLTIRMDRSPPVIVATAAGTAGTQLVHRAGHHPLHLHRQRLRGGRLPRRPNRHRRRHHHS
ncbi:MAG: hypothetical protein QOG44_3526, partial [Acidimicrobiaceae bacterium]|nr:hypothetical protein [Acidimicrobiaceae bacterium]